MESAGKQARICLGVITGPAGVRGEMRFHSYSDAPGDMRRYRALETGEGRKIAVERISVKAGRVRLAVSGVTHRAQAAAFKGTKLYVPRAVLPETGSDEFYHADLVGLKARDTGGRLLGHIAAVQNFGAGDLLEVRVVSETGKNADFFVPFTQAAVPEIDLEGGCLTLDPPPGLIDAPGEKAPA